MTPDALAALHELAIETPAPWDAKTFESFLADPATHLIHEGAGFILIRVMVDEAEILTLAVDPDHRRNGIGLSLVQKAIKMSAESGARTLFLEVAADNLAARTLYQCAGFEETGVRRRYYKSPDGMRTDALTLLRDLNLSTDENHP